MVEFLVIFRSCILCTKELERCDWPWPGKRQRLESCNGRGFRRKCIAGKSHSGKQVEEAHDFGRETCCCCAPPARWLDWRTAAKNEINTYCRVDEDDSTTTDTERFATFLFLSFIFFFTRARASTILLLLYCNFLQLKLLLLLQRLARTAFYSSTHVISSESLSHSHL